MPKSFDFEVSLRGARPKVWRRFLLAYGATFYDLHDAIQRACGWWNCHLFVFRSHPTDVDIAGIPDDDAFDDAAPVPDAHDVRLADYFGQGRLRAEYEYDFGDGWMHDVKLLGVVEHAEKHKRRVLDGARAFPHEDCGGVDGYRRCVTFVKSGKDPFDEGDDKGLRTWLGGWHPEHFDLDDAKRKFDTRPSKKAVVVVSPTPQPASPAANRSANRWCQTLSIEVPHVAEVALRKTTFGAPKLGELGVVALLAHGAPMTDAELVSALAAAGITSGTGDLAKALKRSLVSSQVPLLRDHEERLTVDLHSRDLDLLLFTLGLRGPRYRPSTPPQPTPGDGPLSREEVDAAFDKRISTSDTKARFVAAMLDAERAPMRFGDLVDRYSSYGGDRARFSKADLVLLSKRTDMTVDDGIVHLVDDANLQSMRDAIRKRARGALEARVRATEHEKWQVEHATRERAEREAALRLRRVVISVSSTSIEAFDFFAHERKEFGPGERDAFSKWIASFDVVAGVRPHQVLGTYGVDFHGFQKVVDLLPTKKTVTVDGRPVAVTWDEIVESTLGVSVQPSQLATLMALYRYAFLHGHLWMGVVDGAVRLPIDPWVRATSVPTRRFATRRTPGPSLRCGSVLRPTSCPRW